MDVTKAIGGIREEMKRTAQSLNLGAEICDTPEELEQMNAYLQASLQSLNSQAYLVGLAIKARDSV